LSTVNRKFFGLLLFLLLLAAPIAIFLVPSREARLPDGSRIRFMGVSIGTNSFSSEHPWHRLARRHFPKGLQRWIPRPLVGAAGWTNSISVWFQQKLKTNQTFALQSGRMEIVNDHGETTSGSYFSAPGCLPTLWQGGVAFLNFPRRQSSFLCRLVDSNQQVMATFRVLNPWHGPFPEWHADPLPITKTNGDLGVTFNGVLKVLEAFPPGKTSMWYRANFDCTWQGLPTKEWLFTQSWLSDPTGNRLGALHPGLSVHEPVWRLEACFERTQEATYTEQERCILATLPVLGPCAYTNLDIHTNFQGSSFWIWGWSGAAAVTLSNGIIAEAKPAQPVTNSWTCYELWVRWGTNANNNWLRGMNFTRPTLLMAHIKVPSRIERLYFRDDRGRLCGVHIEDDRYYLNDRFTVSNAYQAWYNHGVILQPTIPPDAKFVTLEVVIQTPRWFEFYLEPPRVEKWIGRR